MRISIVGTGYVGLVSGVCFAEIGHECICVDVDERKVAQINSGHAPIHEDDLGPMLERNAGSRLRATTNLKEAVENSDVTFIAVGTPFDGTRIDLGYIESVARDIGRVLRGKDAYHVVVVKSTVVPGTTDDVVLPIVERESGKQAYVDFGIGMNPEFLTEGSAVADFLAPDRIVLGGGDERTIAMQRDIYAGFENTPILEVNSKTAEMIKYASNSVLATLISFSNEIGNMCSAFGGIDVADVMRGVHLARYFSPVLTDGSRIKAPISSFLWAGCGYGGSCLPKDTKALSAHSQRFGYATPLLDAVIQTNLQQPGRVVKLLEKHFESLVDLQVSILGLAFKEDTDDIRESPAFPIIDELIQRGARVMAYDPIAMGSARAVLKDRVAYAHSLEDALDGAKAVLLITRWAEFGRLPGLLSSLDKPPLLIDGRRMLDPASVPRYEGIGR